MDTRDMRALVEFMKRRFMTKDFVKVSYFTEAERDEFDALCREYDVPSNEEVRYRLQQRQEEDE